MHRLLLPAALALLVTLSACGDVGEAPVAETSQVAADSATTGSADAPLAGTALPLDTAATRIEWTAAKVTRSHDGGFRRFDGALYLDGEALTGAEITIDATSIYSDTDRLTNHLKSDDFFGVETQPEARFRTTAVEPFVAADTVDWADATHRVTGLLTMHGQTNQVTFPARVTVAPDTVTADADFIIDRQQWGLSYPGAPDDLIRDEVRIRLHAVAPRVPATALAPAPAAP